MRTMCIVYESLTKCNWTNPNTVDMEV